MWKIPAIPRTLQALVFLAGSAVAFVAIAGPLLFGRAIAFRSLESKTESGGPVFNRVDFIPGSRVDVWLMQQSHAGAVPPYSLWDRLAIVIDKTKSPREARFYQLAPGRLRRVSWKSAESREALLKEAIPFKARCFACHANGPRALRVASGATGGELGLLDRARIALWNLRIKTYGRVVSIPGRSVAGGVPFRSSFPILARPLRLASCTRCHSETGIRMPLLAEHIGTAAFLVGRGLMPPFPFRMSREDRLTVGRLTGMKD